jgi:hypothetical protein
LLHCELAMRSAIEAVLEEACEETRHRVASNSSYQHLIVLSNLEASTEVRGWLTETFAGLGDELANLEDEPPQPKVIR